MNVTSRLTDSLDQDSSAREFLGDDHPLVRVCDGLSALLRQSLVVTALGVLGVIGLGDGLPGALAFTTAVAAVELALGLGVAVLVQRKRALALSLIVDGREDVPVAAVRRERSRLRDPAHREGLARWIESICAEAHNPSWRPPYARPIFSLQVIATCEAPLAELARALRSDRPGVRGVLRAQRLLERGASPLYGHDADVLRRELRVIRILLDA